MDGGQSDEEHSSPGRGVAPADRARIFDSFYQGPPPVDGRVKGSGLGLAIAREYAQAQGGRIEVASRRDGRAMTGSVVQTEAGLGIRGLRRVRGGDDLKKRVLGVS